MHADDFGAYGLICPRCRRRGPEGPVQSSLRLEQVLAMEGDHILYAFLACSRPGCGAIYPVMEGIPVVLGEMAQWWRSEHGNLMEDDRFPPQMARFFSSLERAEKSPYDEDCLMGSYLDNHYGEFTPSCGSRPSWADNGRFWRAAAGAARPASGNIHGMALDIGCSVGRFTFELARFSRLAVGMDIRLGALRHASRFHRTGNVMYRRRVRGTKFDNVQADFRPKDNVLFIAGDVLDPPFGNSAFDLVAGLNLIDTVRRPLSLLVRMNELLAPGGTLVLSSPYEWRREIADAGEWLESEEMDAPQTVRAILEGKRFAELGLDYSIDIDAPDIPWSFQNHERYWSVFRVALLGARKGR